MRTRRFWADLLVEELFHVRRLDSCSCITDQLLFVCFTIGFTSSKSIRVWYDVYRLVAATTFHNILTQFSKRQFDRSNFSSAILLFEVFQQCEQQRQHQLNTKVKGGEKKENILNPKGIFMSVWFSLLWLTSTQLPRARTNCRWKMFRLDKCKDRKKTCLGRPWPSLWRNKR